jgi:predicted  nucleic acid-binding Zn-ribbon protein
MATEEIFDKLRALQDVLAKKIELEREMNEIPKMLTTQEELLLRLKKAWIEKDQEYLVVKTAEGECRNQLFEAESTREKAEKHMDAISTQREYENLDKEIREATEKEQQYRKELHQIDQKIADLNTQMRQSKELMDQQETELQERRTMVEADVAERKSQLQALEVEEKKLTKGMDGELLFKFERIIKKKGGKGIVSIKNGVCSCCHMILPAQFANDVRSGKNIVSCPYCSSILSYEESRDGEEDYFDNDTAGSLSDLEDLDEDDYDEDEEAEGEDDKAMEYEE